MLRFILQLGGGKLGGIGESEHVVLLRVGELLEGPVPERLRVHIRLREVVPPATLPKLLPLPHRIFLPVVEIERDDILRLDNIPGVRRAVERGIELVLKRGADDGGGVGVLEVGVEKYGAAENA